MEAQQERQCLGRRVGLKKMIDPGFIYQHVISLVAQVALRAFSNARPAEVAEQKARQPEQRPDLPDHKGKAVFLAAKAVETKAKGAVLAHVGSGDRWQRQCLSRHVGSGKTQGKGGVLPARSLRPARPARGRRPAGRQRRRGGCRSPQTPENDPTMLSMSRRQH